MLNKYKVTFEGYALSQKWSPSQYKEHLENELKKLRLLLVIKKLEVKPVGELYTRREML